MSLPDPFDEFNSAEPIVRRRDLREPSTRRSRRDSRRRGEAARKLAPARRAGTAPRSRAAKKPVKKPLGRRIARGLFSVVALLFVAGFAFVQIAGLLAPTTSAASASGLNASSSSSTTAGSQTLTSDGTDPSSIARDKFAATSIEAYGHVKDLSDLAGYTVDNSGAIRWPFDTAVPLGDPFGPRAAPCPGCSTFHNGTDFETGDKAPVYAIAAGTVTQSGVNGSLGYSVGIDHDVKGSKFTSIYGHMTAGSLKVNVGDKITKGEEIGITGSTGESTGPHLDFEINVNDKPIDSFVWLKKHTAH